MTNIELKKAIAAKIHAKVVMQEDQRNAIVDEVWALVETELNAEYQERCRLQGVINAYEEQWVDEHV